jgi:hypothetical protein
MGLDFSHGDAHWGYISFNGFRTRLAATTGRTLESFWTGQYNDHPLAPLLNHSDCDGEISPEDCARVAPALKAIMEQWPENDSDRHKGLLLVEAMQECVVKKEPLEFQ